MSQQLSIDGFAFARDGRALAGKLPVAAMLRLYDLLTQTAGEVGYRLEGVRGERGQPQLRLTVEGRLSLACQRCLQAISHDLIVNNLLELVPEGSAMSQEELEDDSRDFLPVAGNLDVAALVEDEILLSLPVAPRHASCGLPGANAVGEEISPFAALAAMKGRPN